MNSNDDKNPWITHHTTTPYRNPWITLEHNEVSTPAGTPGIYGVVRFKNIAIGILPLDHEMNTWIVGQYRYTLNQYSWEIPEGGCPIGTDPLQTAKRELKEETGLSATLWTSVLSAIQLSNSVSDEIGYSFVAQGLTVGESEPEETEELKVRKLPFRELVEMAMNGEIKDMLSLSTIFKVKLLLDQGAIKSKT